MLYKVIHLQNLVAYHSNSLPKYFTFCEAPVSSGNTGCGSAGACSGGSSQVVSILSKLEDHSYFFTQIKSEARAGGPFDKVKVRESFTYSRLDDVPSLATVLDFQKQIY